MAKFQMAPMPSSVISSGSKKKEPRYACLSEAKASHSHKMWTEVSSSVPHFLRMRSLHNPMICKCLFKVLCPVSRPITILACVLLKDNSRAPIARSGPEINSQACLCVLLGPRHNARCWFFTQHFIFLLIFCLETPKKSSGRPIEPLSRTIPCELVGDFIPSHSGIPGAVHSYALNIYWEKAYEEKPQKYFSCLSLRHK